jgi:hypothetical protein
MNMCGDAKRPGAGSRPGGTQNLADEMSKMMGR